ncbi:MAG: hypothetical protein LBJ84_05215 [Oscillospiraceae bacterium]|jgi:hypothetical protein|nr:hypothetical protein [Oscillospiraceae bacterium]
MFIISNAAKNIRRYSRKSALYFLICAVAALTLEIYMAGIDRTEKQLIRLPDGIPISARVANLDGSRYAGLQILESTADGLLNSEYVRDLKLTVVMGGWIGYAPEDYIDQQTGFIIGSNTIAAFEGLSPDDISWLPGCGPDFLNGNEAVCLADTGLMNIYGWSVGDKIPLSLYCYKYGSRGVMSYVNLETVETRVVGAADMGMATADGVSPSVIVPFESARSIFHRCDIPFQASSASFYVRDALRLNDFKAEMKTLRLSDYPPVVDVSMMVLANQGTALMVNDSAFISAATRLRESLSTLRGFLPLLAAALAVIGYFAAYLMIQTRRGEYAVFRLLGMGKRGAMALYFTEIAALTLGGSLIGALISAAAGIGGPGVGIRVFVMFSVFFMLGGVIALWRLGRANVMLALTQSN